MLLDSTPTTYVLRDSTSMDCVARLAMNTDKPTEPVNTMLLEYQDYNSFLEF